MKRTMKGISVMKKVIVFLVISLSISLILTSCNSEDDNVYETSVGIIDNTDEIKDIHTYQLAWIDSGIVDGLSDDEWSSFIAECRYCFIPTSDYSWVKSFAKEKNIPCYNFNQSELLLGVILDTSDIAVLIPVDATYMNGDHPNDISLEPDEIEWRSS